MNTEKPTGWIAWLSVAVTAATLAGIIILSLNRRPHAENLRRSAVATPRLIEGRLCGFAHAKLQSSARPGRHNHAARLDVRAAAAAILADPSSDPHTSAIAALLYGNTHDAVVALESLVVRQPKDPRKWSDLAAARLEEGTSSDEPRTIGLALVAADRALSLEPALAEAAFNRALALDALGLRFASADAWRRYLTLDGKSSWSTEARDRLRAAEIPTRTEAWKKEEVALAKASEREDFRELERIVSAFPQQSRTAVESSYLPDWAQAMVRGDMPRARRALALSRHVGATLQQVNGDALVARIVTSIDTRNSHQIAAFAAYGHARSAYAERKSAIALPYFEKAEHGFASTHQPMELIAAYYRANVLIDLGQMEAAKGIATRLEACIEHSDRSLRAHLMWLRARFANDAGRYYEALIATREAREHFDDLGELDYAARLRIAEGELLGRMGRDREAWQCRRMALADTAASGRWNLIEVAISAIARTEIEGGHRDIARSLLDVQVAAPSTLPLMHFNGLLWRAFLDEQQRNGLPDTKAARAASLLIPDPKQRADALDELRLAEGLAVRETDPALADRFLTAVIDYRTSNHLLAHLPSIHRQRARVRKATSRVVEAEQDLRRAIDLIESRRVHIRNDSLRDAFLGNSGDAYGELAELLLERGEWQQAFEISERARARILLDHAGREVMPLAQLTAVTPAEVIAAHYTTFASHTLLVVIEKARATHYVVDVGRSELQSLRDRLAVATQHDETEEAARLSRRLHDLLIAPFRSRMTGHRLLIVIPDDAIYGIPFAALREREGWFLVEEIAVVIAPTAAAIPNGPASFFPRDAKVAVLADPALSTALFPSFERLPAARRDADALIAIFPGSITMVGEAATRSALASAAAASDLLHIATHALSSERDASLSLLALARTNADDGVLYLSQIESLDLRRRPLIVLAGCQTASFGGGKGSIRSLAHAFLAAGGRSVLASLWSVEDDAASALTLAFYRNIAAGEHLPAALRNAQLKVMRSRPPREWAAFQLHVGV